MTVVTTILARLIAVAKPYAVPGGLALALVAALALLVGQCNGRRAAEAALAAERARAAEGRELERAGQVVVEAVPDLAPRVATLEAENADLKAALEAARKAAKGARPVMIAHGSTGPVKASGKPRDTPSQANAATPGASPAPISSPVPAPTGHSGEGATSSSCLLAEGDQGEIRVDAVALQTRAGNRVLVGAASAHRLNPEARLFGGSFSAPVTWAAEREPATPAVRRWGAGPWLGVSSSGVAVGAAVAAPPARLFGIGLELSLGGGVTPDGRGQGAMQLILRP